MNRVILSPEYFPSPTIGRPISGAQIFVGIVDLDPEILANQKQISVQQESGTIVEIDQPVLTGAGGVPLYQGSPVTILVDGNYSLKVLNKEGSQPYYVPSQADFVSTNEVSDMLGLINITGRFDGDVANMLGFFATFPQSSFIGGGQFTWQEDLNKNLANGGTIIDPDNTGGFDGTISTRDAFLAAQGGGAGTGCWVRTKSYDINASWFGAVGDATNDDYEAIQAAIDSIPNGGTVWLNDAGDHYISEPLVLRTAQNLRSNTISTKITKTTNATHKGIDCGIYLDFDAPDSFLIQSMLDNFFLDTTSSSDFGIYGAIVTRIHWKDLKIFNFTTGVRLVQAWVNHMDSVTVKHCTTGFDLGNLVDTAEGTSTTLTRCYVDDSVVAYSFTNMTYCSMVSCAADDPTDTAYNFDDARVTMVNCGTERNEGNLIKAVNSSYISCSGFTQSATFDGKVSGEYAAIFFDTQAHGVFDTCSFSEYDTPENSHNVICRGSAKVIFTNCTIPIAGDLDFKLSGTATLRFVDCRVAPVENGLYSSRTDDIVNKHLLNAVYDRTVEEFEVSTVDVTVSSVPFIGRLMVIGKDQAASTVRFYDEVLVTAFDATSVKTTHERGAPQARTYTITGTVLALKMAAGTYDIMVVTEAMGI